jgi:hypothetical protein
MNANEHRQLAWEVNRGGTTAELFRRGSQPRRRDYGYGVKLIALSKMMEVAALSTEFTDYPIVFEPWVVIAADRGSSIDFCGLYQRGFQPEEGEPDLCLRRAHWKEEVDREQFRAAPDKQAYLRSDRQVTIETAFGLLQECPSLTELAGEVEGLILTGCSLRRCRRRAQERSNFYGKVRSKTLPYSWDLTYALEVLKCPPLEAWADRWLACARSLRFPREFFPAGAIEISYATTLFDRLEMMGSG